MVFKAWRFCFGWTVFVKSWSLLENSYSGMGGGGGGFWEFSLVQSSKIQLNDL